MGKRFDLSKKIMAKIKKKQLKIKSKKLIFLEQISLAGSLVLSFIFIILLINSLFFWLKTNHQLAILTLGKPGWIAFLEAFPYLRIFLALFLFIFASLLLKKYDISYKKPYKWLLILIFLSLVITALLLIKLRFNERLGQQIHQGRFRRFQPLFHRAPALKKPHSLQGQIQEKTDKYLVINFRNHFFKVFLDEETKILANEKLETNDWIIAVGEFKNGYFKAKGLIKMASPPPLFRGPRSKHPDF